MKTQIKNFIQTHKAWFILPLIMLPFIILLGWSLGVGSSKTVTTKIPGQQGLSTTLPEPAFDKKELWDKLSLYELAQQDSERFEEARKNDPYYELVAVNTRPTNRNAIEENDSTRFLLSKFPRKQNIVENPIEHDVNAKLEDLYAKLNQPPRTAQPVLLTENVPLNTSDPQFTNDVDRLERVMESLQTSAQPNPEMQQIENVLDKILDVQHPERIKDRKVFQSPSHTEVTTRLEKVTSDNIISLVSPANQIDSMWIDSTTTINPEIITEPNGFYSLESDLILSNQVAIDILAAIHDTQKVSEGSIVKLRLLTDTKLNDHQLSAGQFIYGTVSFNNERLKININSIRHEVSIMQVALKVFDMDGMEGVSIPGSRTQGESKSVASSSLQNVQVLGMNPTLETQAASAGVEVVKNLFGKRIKHTSVTLKAGYQVLLKAATQTVL